jgi:(p)ppGpp synthase/HD superfamily hydrolase
VPAFSPRLDAALVFSARAHRTQVRKGSDTPYIIHPVHVAMLLAAHGFDEDLAIAGLLHDTVEDCGVPLQAIAESFGDGVAALVNAVTEQKTDDGGEKRPWRVRKQDQLDHLAGADARSAALKAADALHNASSTLADLRAHGPVVWERFNARREDSLWYYGEVARLVRGRLGDHSLTRELEATVAEIARHPT